MQQSSMSAVSPPNSFRRVARRSLVATGLLAIGLMGRSASGGEISLVNMSQLPVYSAARTNGIPRGAARSRLPLRVA